MVRTIDFRPSLRRLAAANLALSKPRRITRVVRFALALLAVTGLIVGARRARQAPPSPGTGIGGVVANFALRDAVSGRMVSLDDFRGRRAVVVAFTGTDCPLSNLYMGRLIDLSVAYRDKGVTFVAINSNSGEGAEQVAEHARGHGAAFPVLKDTGNEVADQLHAQRTCEVLVVDGRRRLRYRGAIDNQYGLRSRQGEASRSYLVEALDAILAGRAVEVVDTPVSGCPIERVVPSSAVGKRPKVRPAAPEIVTALAEREGIPDVGPVTFSVDVAPILQAKCQSCHRPGQVGPFSLLTYDQARRRSRSIREVVEERRMPPWHADPRHGRFANDRSLTARQRAVLLAWVDQGTPSGDPALAPAPRVFPEGWSIGSPDVVYQMGEPFEVPAQGTITYQNFRVPTGFAEDRWVQAAEAMPGDRAVVHHVCIFVDDGRPANNGHVRDMAALVCYAPGDMPSVFPPGCAKRLPAGATLVFQVHYTPIGVVRTDRCAVGLIFARSPVSRVAITTAASQKALAIPAGARQYPVRSSFTFPSEAHLLSLTPHMHLRGQDFRYSAAYPDGTTELLLSVPAYDFGWQSVYRLAEPKRMPQGTRIDCLAHFDNSADNPNNPDPTKTVHWGEQTWDEMMIGYIDYVVDLPTGKADGLGSD